MTGNKIGDEGAKGMMEMLQVNTTLSSLKLLSGEEKKEEGQRKEINDN